MTKKWAVQKKTINISQQTKDALAELVELTGMSETQLFNEAIQALLKQKKED